MRVILFCTMLYRIVGLGTSFYHKYHPVPEAGLQEGWRGTFHKGA